MFLCLSTFSVVAGVQTLQKGSLSWRWPVPGASHFTGSVLQFLMYEVEIKLSLHVALRLMINMMRSYSVGA